MNTCLKGIESLSLKPGETVLVIGQGPIGIILGAVGAPRRCARVITSDLYPQRLTIAKAFGIAETIGRQVAMSSTDQVPDRRSRSGCSHRRRSRQRSHPAGNGCRPSRWTRNVVCANAAQRGGNSIRRPSAWTRRRCWAHIAHQWICRTESADFVFNSGMDLDGLDFPPLSAGAGGRGDAAGCQSAAGFDEDSDQPRHQPGTGINIV